MRLAALTLFVLLAVAARAAHAQALNPRIEAPALEPRAEDVELLERHDACGHCPRLWLRAEYLLWYIKNHDFPALITSGMGVDRPGALGQPGTNVLFGGADVETQIRQGARITGGVWLDDNGDLGVEASYFFLGSRAVGREVAGTDTTPIVARPFFDVVNNRQDSSLDVFPGLL